jgi:hypothetical protein
MAPKVLAFIITLILNIAIGVAVFFVLLLAMNGYSESDANYGFIAYIILALIVSLLMGSSAAIVANVLQKRKFSGVVSSLIAIVAFTGVGAALKGVCALIGVGIAELVRVNF